MTVKQLIERLSAFDPNTEVMVFAELPEALSVQSVIEGEEDGGLWVDTKCDGALTGREKKVVQLRLNLKE